MASKKRKKVAESRKRLRKRKADSDMDDTAELLSVEPIAPTAPSGSTEASSTSRSSPDSYRGRDWNLTIQTAPDRAPCLCRHDFVILLILDERNTLLRIRPCTRSVHQALTRNANLLTDELSHSCTDCIELIDE